VKGLAPKLALVLGAFFVLSSLGAVSESITDDEALHLNYGYRSLTGDFERGWRFNGQMPWNGVQALPGAVVERTLGDRFYPKPGDIAPSRTALVLGRFATLLVAGLGLGAGLAALAYVRSGRRAALATVALLALEPNFLAHGHYVTTDAAACATVVLIVLAATLLVRAPSIGRAAALGAAIGLGLVCKLTALHALIGLSFGLLPEARGLSLKRVFSLGAVAVAVAVLVVDTAYQFQWLPGRFHDPAFSHQFAGLVGAIGRPPTPVSGRFWEGLDLVLAVTENHLTYGPIYLLGELDLHQRGFALYYPVVLALKLPLPLFVLLLVSCWKRSPERSWILAAVAGEMAVYFLLVFRVQIGFRYLLPLIALLLVRAGEALAQLSRGSPRERLAASVLVVWQALSVLSFAPTFCPYVNELVLDRKLTYRLIADSNVDFGQADAAAVEWARAERAKGRVVYVRPEKPVTGTVLVKVNDLVGIANDPFRYQWLRNRTPVGHVAYAYLVFEVDSVEPRGK
jgi:hypothetical protein